MKGIVAGLLLFVFVSAAQAESNLRPPEHGLPSEHTTFGWDCVKEELELVEGQSLKGRDQALRKKLGYTIEWFDNIEKDPELTDQEKMEKIKAVSDQYQEEKSTWLEEILLPYQYQRLQQCRYWLAFKVQPMRALKLHLQASNDSIAAVEEVYQEYIKEAIELYKESRIKKGEVYEKNLLKGELRQLLKLSDKPKLETADYEWIRRVVIPKVRDDMAELNEKLQEKHQELFNAAQVKMIDSLTPSDRLRWDQRAGERCEFPVHPNEIITRIGNDKYSPDGPGKRPQINTTPRRPLPPRPQ
jgi:hypothetical protein